MIEADWHGLSRGDNVKKEESNSIMEILFFVLGSTLKHIYDYFNIDIENIEYFVELTTVDILLHLIYYYTRRV